MVESEAKWDLCEVTGPHQETVQILDEGKDGLTLVTGDDGGYFDREAIKKITAHLQAWLKTGSLELPKELPGIEWGEWKTYIECPRCFTPFKQNREPACSCQGNIRLESRLPVDFKEETGWMKTSIPWEFRTSEIKWHED